MARDSDDQTGGFMWLRRTMVVWATFMLTLLIEAANAATPTGIDPRFHSRPNESGEPAIFSAHKVPQDLLDEAKSDPTLTKYIRTASKAGQPAHLVISRSNAKQGLVAAYSSDTGKRILFRAQFRANGRPMIQVLHFDSIAGKYEQLVGKSKQVDEKGQAVKDVEVAGVDMRAFMKSVRQKSNGHAEKELHLKQFAASEAGQALLEGIPALYAALEFVELEPKVERLLAPFGAVAMSLQLSASNYQGSRAIENVVGAAQANGLRSTCGIDNCQLRGSRFMVHPSGLFDVITKQKGGQVNLRSSKGFSSNIAGEIATLKRLASSDLVKQLRIAINLPYLLPRLMDGDGSCSNNTMGQPWFGYCGPEGQTPGNIWTIECYGHDYCECAYGHGACITSVPANCSGNYAFNCYSLWDAVSSYFDGIWDAFWDWVESWLDQDPEPCEPQTYCDSGGP